MAESTPEHCLRHTTTDQVCGGCFRGMKSRMQAMTKELIEIKQDLTEMAQWTNNMIVNYGELGYDVPEQH